METIKTDNNKTIDSYSDDSNYNVEFKPWLDELLSMLMKKVTALGFLQKT